MTSLDLMQMTTLAQDATNLVSQFVKIELKILPPYLCNRTLPLLDNVGIKSPKTMYNNEKLAPKIKQFVIEHI